MSVELTETVTGNGKDPILTKLEGLQIQLDTLNEVLISVVEGIDELSEKISNLNANYGDGFGVES